MFAHAGDWLRRAGVSALAAPLLTAAWVAPVLAELDDGDGFDGDELVLPPVLLALGGVAVWALLRGRRGGTPSAGTVVRLALAPGGCRCLGALAAGVVVVAACTGGQARVAYRAADRAAPLRWAFDGEPVGGLSPGAAAFTGSWAVRAEPDAPSPPNALCQTATAEFPALALGDAVYGDVVVAARFKPLSGRTDQAAGVIFRVQDKDNYYILRANALENNVVLFKYAGGRRSTIKEGSATVAAGRWQSLRAEAVGNRLRGYLNEQLVLETTDDTYQAGKVGLWTKADSVTCFDDVEARAP